MEYEVTIELIKSEIYSPCDLCVFDEAQCNPAPDCYGGYFRIVVDKEEE